MYYTNIAKYDKIFIKIIREGESYMKSKTVKVLTKFVAPIVVAFIGGAFSGVKYEQKNTRNYIKNVMGNNININGNENDIIINDIETFTQNYLKLSSDYESLKQQKDSFSEQSAKYFDDLTDANNTIDELNIGYNQEIEDLKKQLDSAPVIDYKNLALCIDVDDIPINSNNSMVTIDGRDYFSREIVENIIPENKNMTIKNDTIFLGQVVTEKANLSHQYVKSKYNCEFKDSIQDSFGYMHTDCLTLDGGWQGDSEIQFSLQNKYDMLDCEISVYGNYTNSKHATITIKTNEGVLKSYEITEDTITIPVEGLAINKCLTLTISKKGSDSFGCVISNAIVYN